MLRYAVMRVLQGVATLALVATFAFALTQLIGDPVLQLLPLEHTEEQYLELRHSLGYDQAWYVQYTSFIRQSLVGDFGTSVTYNMPAMQVVLSRVPVTASLAAGAMALAILVGIPIGVVAGYRPFTPWDRVSITVATIGQAVPPFVIAILGILVFAVRLHLVPSGGWGTWQSAILPVGGLALGTMSGQIRLARSGIREVMGMPFIVLARAKGLKEAEVLFAHALRPAILPVITYGGLQLGILLTGAIVTETVFAIPGLGLLVVDAVSQRDQSVVRAAVLVGATGFVIMNTLVDLSYGAIDPRVRARRRA